MQRQLEHMRRYMVGAPRIYAAMVYTFVLAAALYAVVFTLNLVTVTDNHGINHVLLTARDEPGDILQLAGVTANAYDEVVYTEHSENTASIVINRAFTTGVEADGRLLTAEFVEGTVADLLAATGVMLGEEDFTTPGLSTPLEQDMTVLVHRVTYGEESLRTEVNTEDAEAYIEQYEQAHGITFLRSNTDTYDITYRYRYIDGEVESSEILNMLPVLSPREEGDTSFTAGVPISRITEGFEDVVLTPEGIPAEYSSVIESGIATAYSSSGGRGASGLGLYYGTVAVDPRVIPYGSRLYITSADNSFVYGFAIATDTGSAMREGRVDIDLYFETNAECLRFGKRRLNIYILDAAE